MPTDDSRATGHISPFERIKYSDEAGEYWSARELAKLLDYSRWQEFDYVIERAKSICELLHQNASRHFQKSSAIAALGSGAVREIMEYRLSRYALYLILLCSDVKKPEVVHALAFLAMASLDDSAAEHATKVRIDIPDPRNIAITKEQTTIGQIMRAFRHLRSLRQYHVAPYYVDLYFPDERVVVECDENGHTRYSWDIEDKRQRHIESVLHCTFVRYNPDDPDFNISDVINRIMRLVYEGQSVRTRECRSSA